MSELLKMVASRLAERQILPGADGASHPDADVLAAFAERALPERERVPVLRHLADCAHCREVVALAQPALADAPAVSTGFRNNWTERFWSRGSMLRWGVLAASAALAVSLAVRHGGEKPGPVVAEQKATFPSPVAAGAAKSEPATLASAPVNQPAVDKNSKTVVTVEANKITRSEADALAVARPRRTTHPFSFGPSAPMSNNNAGFVANDNTARTDTPSAPRPEPSTDYSYAGGMAAQPQGRSVAPLPRSQDLKAAPPASATAPPPASSGIVGGKPMQDSAAPQILANESLAKAKAAAPAAASETVEVTASAASIETAPGAVNGRFDKDELHASSSLANLTALSAARQAAIWQISPAGSLQRSADGGKTWESVTLDQPVRLRAVAATGFHVWAGGNSGALFHSPDGGSHFDAVKVHKRRALLTGDIVTLSFQDAQHGRLETASHEVWTTKDGGQSWQRP